MTGRHRPGRPAPTHWVALGLGVLLAGCAGGTPGSGDGAQGTATADVALECGLSTFPDGQQAMRYCGDGVAVVSVGDMRTPVGGAACERRGDFVTANFGTNYSDDKAARGNYVGLLLSGPSSGKDPAEVKLSGVEIVVDGKRQPLSEGAATAVLQDKGLQGTVTGQIGEDLVTIEFDCRTS